MKSDITGKPPLWKAPTVSIDNFVDIDSLRKAQNLIEEQNTKNKKGRRIKK